MSGFKVYKVTANPVVLNDLGVTLVGIAGTVIDLTHLEPTDIARSTDLVAAINGTAPFATAELLVVDPRDDSDTTNLSQADSLEAVARHNDTHFGISGGRFGTVDDPTTSINDGDIIRFDAGTGEFAACNPSNSGSIWNAQGIDGIDTTFVQTSNTVLREGQDEGKYDGAAGNGSFTGGDSLVTPIAAQTDTNYDGVGSNGSFTGGNTYNAGDVITLSNGATVTVNTTAGAPGPVATFTVTTAGAAYGGGVLTQTGVVPAGGTGFTLTPGPANLTGDYEVGDTINLSDGSVLTVDAVDTAGDVTQFTVTVTGNTNVTAGVALTQTGTSGTGNAFTLTPQTNNISEGTIQWDVNDAFLRNNGDTLDSGTLQIASGATVNFAAGSTLTIDGAVTQASITTPAGGFSNATDIINKGYVDSIAQGIDWKESVRASTTPTGGDIGGTYNSTGGTGGSGEFTNVDLTSDALWDGTPSGVGPLAIGDRLLVKDQTDPKQNGIYVITTAGATGTIERAPDQDGTPSSEVSGGNTTFVENGTVNGQTIWSVVWDGIVTLNTDPVNWTQTGAATSIIANEGLNSTGNRFNLDISTLTQTATITTSDVLAFQDVAGSAGTDTTTTKTTVANFLSDLNIVTVTTNGIVVNNGGTYVTRQIAVNGAGPLDGLAVSNADGTGGNPTLGLDIQNLPLRTAIDAVNDRVAVWDSNLNTNVYYTVGDIASAASATNSYTNWTRTGNGSGGPIGPGTSTDTIQWIGGIGIDINMSAGAPDTIEVEFTRSGMANTAIVSTDTFPFFDGSNADEPEYRSFADMLTDLDIVNGITPNGIVVQTATDTYAGKAIAASTLEDEDGLVVTNGDGTGAGNMIIGLDILNMTSSPADMAATDEFPVHDKSEGTAGANRKMTGQQIADGVADILNIDGLTFATFTAATTPAEDQTLLAYVDSTRTGSPTLSVETHTFAYSDNLVDDNSWIDIGDASDADSGYIMPLNGMVVGAAAHCEDPDGNTFDIDLYIDGVDNGAVATLSGTGNQSDSDPTLEISFTAGQKLRLRGDRTAGSDEMGDTVVYLMVRWEA